MWGSERGKWYNMQKIDMSEKMPMVDAANVPPVKYSAAYSTGRERITNSFFAAMACLQ